MYSLALLAFFYSPIISILVCMIFMMFSKKSYLYCILIAITLSIVAFFFTPPPSYDLYRIFEKIEWFKNMNILEFLKIYSSNLEIGFNFVLLLIVKNLNKHFVPMIFSLIGYLIMFYIICDYSKIKKISSSKTVFIIIVFLLSYQHMYLISGIRNFIAIIFFVLLLYIEKIKKKENIITHILYIIPLLFHNSMFVFILFRLLIEFKDKISEKIVAFVSAITLFAPFLILKILELFNNNSVMFNIYTKFNGYINNNSKFYQFLIVASMILQLFMYAYTFFYTKKVGLTNTKFHQYTKYMIILAISLIPYPVLFDRVLVLLSCLTVVTLIDYVDSISSINKYNKFFCYLMILIITMFLFRNQVHNYFYDIKSAINIVANNNLYNLLKLMGVIK